MEPSRMSGDLQTVQRCSTKLMSISSFTCRAQLANAKQPSINRAPCVIHISKLSSEKFIGIALDY